MYHAVGHPVSAQADTFLNVSEDSFRRQIRALESLGYRARRFEELIEAVRSGTSLPPRSFVVTFDDAYACVRKSAAPVLKEFDFPATVFAISSWCEHPDNTENHTGGISLPVMSWEDLKGLQAQGWEIGGHTRSHVHLDELDDFAAFEEILKGKSECESALGSVVTSFCYPYGHLNSNTIGLLQRAGFRGACTVRSGIVKAKSDPFLLPRVKVGYRDGVYGLLYRMLVRPGLPNFRTSRRSEQIKSVPKHI